jgi:hypothetical protein
MKYSQMTKTQKDFLKDVVLRIYNSIVRKVHSKKQALNVCKAAYHSKYGVWPTITEGTINTLLQRARKEDGVIIVPEATGKGMVCTYGHGKNETPALIDHVNAISAQQQKQATATRNVRINLVIPFIGEMMPAANILPENQKPYFQIIEDGNKAIANEIIKTERTTQIRYKQVPYYVDENGKEVELKQVGA